MKNFIKDNGGLIALIVTIAAGMWWIQSTIAQGQIEQQKQFKEMIEKIAQVDKQSLVRDHELEMKIVKLSK